MKLNGTRFGTIEIAEEDVLEFPKGILGFSGLRRFALLPHGSSMSIAWLQSIDSPDVALPVVSAHAITPGYDETAMPTTDAANPDVAALLVLTATVGLPATVNRRAPILVDANTRRGEQIVLDSNYPTRAAFELANPENAQATAA